MSVFTGHMNCIGKKSKFSCTANAVHLICFSFRCNSYGPWTPTKCDSMPNWMICRHKLNHFTVTKTRFTAPLTRSGKTKFATIKWYNLCRQIIQSQTCYPLIYSWKLGTNHIYSCRHRLIINLCRSLLKTFPHSVVYCHLHLVKQYTLPAVCLSSSNAFSAVTLFW